MLSRFSVKRPYVIVVAVIIALILGGVSVSKMKTDLLPEMDMPYLAVITTDPGASAEKVESEVTDVLEDSLSTVSGVSNISSQSSDNVSVIFLEFADGTDMDSALVKVSSAANEVTSRLPETAGAPNFMEISMDMMATLYAAASYDGHDIYQTSEFVEEAVVPELERLDGVATVSTTGSAEQSVEVRLSDDKIEDINNELLSSVNGELSNAKKQIDEGEAQLAKAESTLAEQKDSLEGKQAETSDQLGQAISGLTLGVSGKASELSTIQAQIAALASQLESPLVSDEQKVQIQAQIAALQDQAKKVSDELSSYQKDLAKAQSGSMTAASQFGSAQAQLSQAQATIDASKSQLAEARSQYETSRDQAISQANIDTLVDKDTLSQLISAQNFSMPAGYLKSDSDTQWLVRVGEKLDSVDELKGLLLADIDGVGEIRLSDVADITVVDNVGDSYMKINGADGVLLSVFKSSTANTSDVSHATADALEKLERDNPGLHLNVVSDQGSYIDLYISSILQSLLIGALLAIVVLALFLKDWKPTLIVAFSIPFSVLFALVLMYFSGISINVMSLGGIALAIGMLVDNSIIVLENIYRLRARGLSAPRAAVQGAKQITGAVIASTLTTICVFLPIVFTTGMVNQMMLPFSLTIAYVLAASLLIALTLVPSLSATVFRNHRPRRSAWFEKIQTAYGRSLSFFLRHKAIPLGVAAVLFVAAFIGVLNTGITMIPTMTSKTVSVSVIMPEDIEKDDAYATADKVMEAATGIEGVAFVGGIDGSGAMSLVSGGSSGSSEESSLHEMFTFYLQTDDSVTKESQVMSLLDELDEKTKDLDCEVITDASSSEAMAEMVGSGLSLTISGPDQDKLVELSEQAMAKIDEIDGYTEIENGMEDADTELQLVIDRDKLTKAGYTVAQLYADLSSMLQTEVDATSIDEDGATVDVAIVDETKVPTADKLLDTKIEIADQANGTTKTYELGDFATVEEGKAAPTINHENSMRTMTVTASVEDGYNNALLSRDLQTKLADLELPEGYELHYTGEIENIETMLSQMLLLLVLGFVLIYLVMVAQFESLLSPFIIIFTVPLAFTGGFFALVMAGEPLSMMALMGFAVLMGTVVNNGIVFVDFVNQLRRGGLEKRDALVMTGRTRMRPIMMTALTTILAMIPMVFSDAVGASMQRGMALVIVGGLLYATFMTLYIVPIMYDLLYRRVPKEIDVDGGDIDDDPDDAQAFLEALRGSHAAPAAASAVAGAQACIEDSRGTKKRRFFRSRD